MATNQTGGFISKLFGGKSETASEKYAREDADFRAKHPEKLAPPQQSKPEPKPNGLGGLISGTLIKSMADREKAAGLKNGGDLSTGHGGDVPGEGKGDKIDALYEPGEFVVSNDMLLAKPELRAELQALRKQVLAAKGMTPEQADKQAVKGGAIRALNGLDDEEARRTALVNQIPNSNTAPAADGYDNGNDFTRNVNTSLNALGGMGVVASVPLRAATAGRAAASGLGAIQNSMRAPAMLANGVAGPNFIAGASGVAQVGGANLPTVINAAAPVAKTVNVALQEGAKANQMAAATRSLGNASAGAGMLDGQQAPIMPGAPAQPQAVAQVAGAAPTATGEQAEPVKYGEKWGQLGAMFNYSSDREAMKARQAATSNPAEDARNARAQAAASAKPAAAGALPGTPAAPGTQPATTAPVAILPPDPSAPSGAVTRVGNSYSGGNVAGDITVNGKAPKFGVSSMDTSQGYASDLRQLAEIEKTKQAENANMQAQSDYAENQVLQGKALRGNPAALAILKQRAEQSSGKMTDATTRRGQDQTATNQGAVQKLAQDKFGIDSQGAKLDNEQKQLSMGILKTLLDPKATPEQKAQATAQLQAMAGKTPEVQKPFAVTGGQAVIDGQAVTQPSMVFDPTTRQFINPNHGGVPDAATARTQAQAALKANPANKDEINKRLAAAGYQPI